MPASPIAPRATTSKPFHHGSAALIVDPVTETRALGPIASAQSYRRRRSSQTENFTADQRVGAAVDAVDQGVPSAVLLAHLGLGHRSR